MTGELGAWQQSQPKREKPSPDHRNAHRLGAYGELYKTFAQWRRFELTTMRRITQVPTQNLPDAEIPLLTDLRRLRNGERYFCTIGSGSRMRKTIRETTTCHHGLFSRYPHWLTRSRWSSSHSSHRGITESYLRGCLAGEIRRPPCPRPPRHGCAEGSPPHWFCFVRAQVTATFPRGETFTERMKL